MAEAVLMAVAVAVEMAVAGSVAVAVAVAVAVGHECPGQRVKINKKSHLTMPNKKFREIRRDHASS